MARFSNQLCRTLKVRRLRPCTYDGVAEPAKKRLEASGQSFGTTTSTVIPPAAQRVALGQHKGSKRSKSRLRNPAQIRRQKAEELHE